MNKHAKLSASGSSTWLNCPGSIKASENIKNTSSIFAQEGTFAHAIAELCLTNKCNASYYLNHEIPLSVYHETKIDFIFDKEMCDYIQIYLDYIRSFNLPFKVEVKADYSKWVKDGFGTSDCIMYDKNNKTLHVIDLKYGSGVKVFANNNTQAMLYALGSLSFYSNIENITIHIVQPRLDNIDVSNISYSDLMIFAKHAKQQSQLALSDDAPLIPGDKQCKWCKAKPTSKS